MKKNNLKITAATALLSTTLFGAPLIGDTQGNVGNGHKDGKSSHQLMERKHDRKEHRQGQNQQGYENINWDKKEDGKYRSKDNPNKSIDQINGTSENILNQPDKRNSKPEVPLVTYAEADAYGKETILPLIAGLETARANLDWETLEKNYHSLSIELKRGTTIFYKVEGKANREKLIAIYKVPAQEKRAELALPLSIYMGVEFVEAQLEVGKTGQTAAKLAKLKILVKNLGNVENDALLTDLVAKVNALEPKINAINSMSYYEAVPQ